MEKAFQSDCMETSYEEPKYFEYVNSDDSPVLKGFQMANARDPFYGLQFNNREQLDIFISKLNAAADEVWGVIMLELDAKDCMSHDYEEAEYFYYEGQDGKTLKKGFGMRNSKNEHYGLKFHNQSELVAFMDKLHEAGRETWGAYCYI